MGICSLAGFVNAVPVGPSSTGLRSCAETMPTCAAGGSGGCCIDEIDTATSPGGVEPGSICSAVPCTSDSGASTTTLAPFGSSDLTCADASRTVLAVLTLNDCSALSPPCVALIVKAWLPASSAMGVHVT